MCLSEMKENQKGLIQKINGDSRFVSRVVSMGLPPSSSFWCCKTMVALLCCYIRTIR